MNGPEPAKAVWDGVLEKLWRQSRYTSIFYQFTDFLAEPGIPTLGLWITGKRFRLLYNPDFALKTPPDQLLGLLVHEMLHVLLNHRHRTRPGEDSYLQNLAKDMVINTYLNLNEKTFFARKGFQEIPLLVLPPGLPRVPEAFGLKAGRTGLLDLTWEEVYEWLKNTRETSRGAVPEAEGSLLALLGENPGITPASTGSDDDEGLPLPFRGAGFLDSSGKLLPAGIHIFSQSEQSKDMDAGKRRVLAFLEKSGQCRGERIYSEVASLLNEPPPLRVSWKAKIKSLADHFSRSTRWDISRARPNRRFLGAGMIMPGRVHRQHPILTVAVDLSGSMTNTPKVLEAAFGVVEDLAREYRINFLCMDQELFIPRRRDDAFVPSGSLRPCFYRKGDWRAIRSGSGASTFFAPLFNAYMKGRKEALIVITDGFIFDLPKLAPYPRTVWAIPEAGRERFRPPFGRVVVMEEAP